MAKRRFSDQALMIISLIAAFVLSLVPQSDLVRPIWPFWVAMVMVYWNLEGNRLRHLGQAFAIGLLLDVLTGSLLGQNALSLVVLSFLLERFRNQMRFFPPWQQAIAVMALLLNDRVVQLWVVVFGNEPWPPLLWWTAPLMGMALWPWLFLALDAMRQRRRLPV